MNCPLYLGGCVLKPGVTSEYSVTPSPDSTLPAVLEPMEYMQRAALYARVSTDGQKQEGTIESQVAELKRQIAAAGHVLVKEYIDGGYSGSELDRPALDQMRRDAQLALFDAVYFLCADLIALRVAYQTIIVGELLKHGKQIIISGKDYVHNPENKLTLPMLGAFAEFERPKLIERTTQAPLHRLPMRTC